jgi:hypothetical protein
LLRSIGWHDRYSAIDYSDLRFHSPSNSSRDNFTLTQHAIKSIGAYIHEVLAGPATSEDLFDAADELVNMTDSALFNGALMNYNRIPQSIGGIWGGQESDVSESYRRLAISMTNAMRANGGTESMFDLGGGRITLDSPSEPVVGKIGLPTTLYRIDWYWIILHSIVCCSGFAFVVATIGISAKSPENVPPWKTSALAAMSRGYAATQVLNGTLTTREMEKAAREAEVLIPVSEEKEGMYERGDGQLISSQRSSEERAVGGGGRRSLHI